MNSDLPIENKVAKIAYSLCSDKQALRNKLLEEAKYHH